MSTVLVMSLRDRISLIQCGLCTQVDTLIAMGFPRDRAIAALQRTRRRGAAARAR